jgi:hypothetical protein
MELAIVLMLLIVGIVLLAATFHKDAVDDTDEGEV